jgi:tetratricopeptide (TPR) repeat protein
MDKKIICLLAFFICYGFTACNNTDSYVDEKINTQELLYADTDKQLSFLNELIDDKPDEGELYYLRAKLVADKGNYKQALRDTETAMQKNTPEAKHYFQSAKYLLALDNDSLALIALRKAEKMGFKEIETDIIAAELFVKMQHYDSAFARIQRPYQLVPNAEKVNFCLGAIYTHRNDTVKATSFLRKAIAANTCNVRAYTELMKLALQNKAPQKAIQYGIAAKHSACKLNAEYCEKLAEAYSLIKTKQDSAAYWYKQTIDYSPQNLAAHRFLAEYYLAAQNFVLGEIHLRNASKIDINAIPHVHMRLGYIHEYKLESIEEALKYYRYAQQTDSTSIKQVNEAIKRVNDKIAFKKWASENPELAQQAIARRDSLTKLYQQKTR